MTFGRNHFLVVLLCSVTVVVGCSTGASSMKSSAPPATVTVTPTPTPTITATVTATPNPTPHRKVVTRVVTAPPVAQTSQASNGGGGLYGSYEESDQVSSSGYSYEGGVFFDEPSENIGCYMNGNTGVTCSIHRYDFDQPGHDCNRGIGLTLSDADGPYIDGCSAYYPVADRGNVLQYGESITFGNDACVSESTGVVCLDLDTSEGFTLSREAFTPSY